MLSGNEVSRVKTKQLLGTRLVACHDDIIVVLLILGLLMQLQLIVLPRFV
jgi:hypothetical protein